MEGLLQWGIDLIITIQQIRSPVLNNIFSAITFIGEEKFYLFLLPILFWVVDFGLAARVSVLFLLSSYINVNLKDLFHQPRPFNIDPSVLLFSAWGYGLPSGHSQAAVAIWGSVAVWAHKIWVWVVAIGLIVLIGFSRVYLGVHFPTDVLAGWIIGVLLLWLYLIIQPRVEKRLGAFSIGIQIVLIISIAFTLLLIHPTKNTVAEMALLSGIGIGLTLKYRYVPFHPQGMLWQRALRFLIGSSVIFAFYLGLKMTLFAFDVRFHLVFRFWSYWFFGIWMSIGAPWLFRQLNLSPEAN